MSLAESIEIDGEIIVDYVRELRMVKDLAEAIRWLEKIESMTKAMRWYIKRDRLKGDKQ